MAFTEPRHTASTHRQLIRIPLFVFIYFQLVRIKPELPLADPGSATKRPPPPFGIITTTPSRYLQLSFISLSFYFMCFLFQLIRINPELPLADRPSHQTFTFSIAAGGLEAVKLIHKELEVMRTRPRGISIIISSVHAYVFVYAPTALNRPQLDF